MDVLENIMMEMKAEAYGTVDRVLRGLDKIEFINISYPEYGHVKITVDHGTSDEVIILLEKIRDEILIPNTPLGTCYTIQRRTE